MLYGMVCALTQRRCCCLILYTTAKCCPLPSHHSPTGTQCVNGQCCPNTNVCGSSSALVCCSSQEQCDPIGGQCCQIGGVLPGGGCCTPTNVCGPNCCQQGQQCLNANTCCNTRDICGGNTCCQAGQQCLENSVCCNAGQVRAAAFGGIHSVWEGAGVWGSSIEGGGARGLQGGEAAAQLTCFVSASAAA
jgi:hypothetical protein